MSLTFRKSKGLGKYARGTISKRGPSVSVGPRHAKMSVGRRPGVSLSAFGFIWRKLLR
jgi:hypothetical protein